MSKQDEGKYEPTLVYISFIKWIAKQRRYGINKHGAKEDWRTTEPIKHIDAALRHINAFIDGEEIDLDSPIHTPHLVAAATNLMFEIERQYGQQIKLDNCKHIRMYRPYPYSKCVICLDCNAKLQLYDIHE